PRLRAPPQRRRAGRSSDAQWRVHPREWWVGRRVGLPAVRRHNGTRDHHAAARVPRPPGGVCRQVSGERSARRERDPRRARRGARARAVYALGVAHPGVCQTAPARAPYFYEEDDWADDMELGAVELYALTREPTYLGAALQDAALEPVSPWMGQDTARHYQWYPWHNKGHYQI